MLVGDAAYAMKPDEPIEHELLRNAVVAEVTVTNTEAVGAITLGSRHKVPYQTRWPPTPRAADSPSSLRTGPAPESPG